MRRTALDSALAVVFLMANLGVAAQLDTPHAANSVVVIEGRLRHKQVYGPPGWGETPRLDSKFTVYYLELRQAMSPQQLKLPPSKHADNSYSQVQLYCEFEGCDEFMRKHSNHIVLASGSAA